VLYFSWKGDKTMFKYTDEEIEKKRQEKREEINNAAIKVLVKIKGIYEVKK